MLGVEVGANYHTPAYSLTVCYLPVRGLELNLSGDTHLYKRSVAFHKIFCGIIFLISVL